MTFPSNQICADSERGLLSVAVDPAFTTPGSNYIYVYYTANIASSTMSRSTAEGPRTNASGRWPSVFWGRVPGGERTSYLTPMHFAQTSRRRPSSISFFRCFRVSLFQMPSMPVAKTLAVLVRPS